MGVHLLQTFFKTRHHYFKHVSTCHMFWVVVVGIAQSCRHAVSAGQEWHGARAPSAWQSAASSGRALSSQKLPKFTVPPPTLVMLPPYRDIGVARLGKVLPKKILEAYGGMVAPWKIPYQVETLMLRYKGSIITHVEAVTCRPSNAKGQVR